MRSDDGSVPRVLRWWRAAFAPFWVVPAVWCAGAVLAGIALPEVDRTVEGIPFLFRSGPDGARSLLSTVAGAMISVTGLVFSITVVVLQLASSQFTPRVLRTFLDDRTTQNTLGVFTATFLYSLTVLRSVQSSPRDGYPAVPQLAVAVSFVVVLGAVAMFLAFIHHITHAIAVGSVVGRTADGCRALLRHEAARGSGTAGDAPARTARQEVVAAPRSGYLDHVDTVRLRALARRHDVRLELLHPLGAFVVEGSPLALAHTDAPGVEVDWPAVVTSGVELTRERSMRQDLSFGLRRLVDIAERALSPGVNDPTTAVQVVDELHDLLRRIALRPEADPVTRDEEGVVRVVTRERTFADYLDLAVDEIAHWGADGLQVPPRLDAVLAELAAAAPAHREVLEAKRAQVSRAARAAR